MPSASFEYYKWETGRTDDVKKRFGVVLAARRWVLAGDYQIWFTREWILLEWAAVAMVPERKYRKLMRQTLRLEFEQWQARLRGGPVPLPDKDCSSGVYSDWD